MRFSKDLLTAIFITTSVGGFIFGPAGTNANNYLVSNNIISYTDEGIMIPFLANIYVYLLIAACLSFAGYILIAYKELKGELNTSLDFYAFLITAFLCMIVCLARPLNWFEIAFCFFVLFVLFWLLARDIWFSIKEYN